jgi:YD repeat-containing protein
VEVKPWRTYKLKSKTPVPFAEVGDQYSNKNVLLRKPELFKVTNELSYDDDGNLIQSIADEQTVSYVNDYKGRYVVASVVNSTYNDIAYTSFEADGKGGWAYDPAYIISNGITGSKSFGLTASSQSSIGRSSLTSSKTYILSFWVNGTANLSVNGSTGNSFSSENIAQIGTWKLNKYVITGTNSINISGTGVIDELRLYPNGALMTSTTYKEGIGKTTECDANNRLQYYEYDGLGRLKLIRDQNQNVVKAYEYNFKN